MLTVPRQCRAGLVVPYKRGNPPLVVPRPGCQVGAPVLLLRITSHGFTAGLDISVPNGGLLDMTLLGGGPPAGIFIDAFADSTVFEILNDGDLDLELGTVVVADAGGNLVIAPTVTSPPTTPVVPSGTTPFTVKWSPVGDTNTADLLLTIPSNDPNANPFQSTIRSYVMGGV